MLSQKSTKSKPILLALLIGFLAIGIFSRPTHNHLNIEVITPENVSVSVLLNNVTDKEQCKKNAVKINALISKECPNCLIKLEQCLTSISTQQLNTLGQAPINYASMRFNNGVATFSSIDQNLALKSCRTIEKLTLNSAFTAVCYPPNALRPILKVEETRALNYLTKNFLLFLLAVISSLVGCYIILKTSHLHAHFTHDPVCAGPQKFHTEATPRIGGIAILAALFTTVTAAPILLPEAAMLDDNLLLFAAIPAFIGGVIEDISKNVGTAQRLILTMISAAIAISLIGAVIGRTDILFLDYALYWMPFAALFTVFAIGGVANSINIIDGYNGLASGFSMIVLIAIATVAMQVDDHLVFMISVSVTGAMLGFFVWNWPKGKIFLGDGGSYLLGFMLAELSVLLVCRNPSVSPWFPLSLLAYPIFETLSSMFRRKFITKSACDQPDALHLHHLIFQRLVCSDVNQSVDLEVSQEINSNDAALLTCNNSRVAPYIWATAVLSSIFAIIFHQKTSALMLLTLAGCLLYTYIYKQLRIFPLSRPIRLAKRNL
jgi:UDP-N-acetylmuramyl pentapeptide phosphotransferase/UDP-N-acetylglucosamine-1-phosphate transferase